MVPQRERELLWMSRYKIEFCSPKRVKEVSSYALKVADDDVDLAEVVLKGVIYQHFGETWGHSLWVDLVDNGGPAANWPEIFSCIDETAEVYRTDAGFERHKDA